MRKWFFTMHMMDRKRQSNSFVVFYQNPVYNMWGSGETARMAVNSNVWRQPGGREYVRKYDFGNPYIPNIVIEYVKNDGIEETCWLQRNGRKSCERVQNEDIIFLEFKNSKVAMPDGEEKLI